MSAKHKIFSASLLATPALAAAVAAAVMAPASAQAEPGPAQSPSRTVAKKHCVVDLAEHGKMTCHDTFRKAMADATGGRITDAPHSPAAAVSDRRFNDRLNSTSGGKKSARGAVQDGPIVLSIEYMHNTDGPSRVFTGDHLCSGPTSDVDFSFEDLRTVGFDNTISWFVTYGNCYVAHFEDPYFGGVRTGFLRGPAYVGNLMNDRSSSLRWS